MSAFSEIVSAFIISFSFPTLSNIDFKIFILLAILNNWTLSICLSHISCNFSILTSPWINSWGTISLKASLTTFVDENIIGIEILSFNILHWTL